MTNATSPRHPAGSPAGGQFAPVSRSESDLDLDLDVDDPNTMDEPVFSGREMLDAYESQAATALWSSCDPDAEVPLDQAGYTADDIDPATAAELRADLDDFVGANGATITRIRAEHPDCTPAQVAHDFWLTRNRHGAGFWDRGYGVDGDTLTEAAHAYGGVDLYLGHDGKIHA